MAEEDKARLIRMFNKEGDIGYKIQKLKQYINSYGVDDSLKNTTLADNPKAKKIINKAAGKDAKPIIKESDYQARKKAGEAITRGKGGSGGGGFKLKEKLFGRDPFRRRLMNEGGSVKGRPAKRSAENS
tara:strand:+ start:59 stop:445 length:387 start_codon:yes stop_codon:yes gene_type:complete